MIVYRIAKKKELRGTGAKLTGGPWNPKGFPVLYCASTSSLAVLEKLVHVDFDLLPDDLFIVELEISSNSIQRKRPQDLPKSWNIYPGPDKLKALGKSWIMENEFLILQVPSAVNPNEANFLINVLHKDFEKIQVKRVFPFEIDDRLMK